MLAFPAVRIGTPITHEALTVFPLFGEAQTQIDYLLADEAIAAGTVAVEEVGEAGSVPNLRVSNSGDSRIGSSKFGSTRSRSNSRRVVRASFMTRAPARTSKSKT